MSAGLSPPRTLHERGGVLGLPPALAGDEVTLSKGTLFGWAIGSAGATILFSPYVNLFLRFMTDYLAVPAAVGGAIVGGARILDAVSDVAIGTISDRTRSRWGRRRPYLLVGAILTAFSFIGLFAPPSTLTGSSAPLFFFVVVTLFSVGFAFWYVPYVAMTSEMTNSHAGRSELVSYRITGSAIGGLIGGAGAAYLLVLFGGTRAAHGAMGITIGLIGLTCMLACVFLSRKARTTERHAHNPYTLRQQTGLMFSNRPFFLLILMKLLFYIGMASGSVSMAYFVKYVFGLSDAWLGTFILVQTGSMLAFVPIWLWVSKRVERRTMAIGALTLSGFVSLSYLLARPGDPTVFAVLRFALTGVANSAITLMSFSMLADTMEYDYLTTGLRREGLFAGFVTLIEKSANAVGIALVGIMLSQMGYLSSKAGVEIVQSKKALVAIYLGFSIVPAALTFSGALVLIAYLLTKRRLDALRESGPPNLTARDG